MNGENYTFPRDIVRLIGRLEKRKRQYLDSRLEGFQLKGTMFMILLFLDRNPNSSQDVLGEFIGIDKSGIARKCSRLEELNYIRREPSKDNKRQYELTLTAQGRDLLQPIRQALFDWSNTVTDGLTQDQQMQMLRFLEAMVHNTMAKDGE